MRMVRRRERVGDTCPLCLDVEPDRLCIECGAGYHQECLDEFEKGDRCSLCHGWVGRARESCNHGPIIGAKEYLTLMATIVALATAMGFTKNVGIQLGVAILTLTAGILISTHMEEG